MKTLPALTAIGALLLTAAACQTPFGTDRHALVGDRVAAVVLHPDATATQVAPVPWLVVGDRTWSDEPVALSWVWLDPEDPDIDAVDVDQDPLDGQGVAPVLTRPHPLGRDVLGLIAQFPSGTTWRVVLPMEADGPTPLPAISRIQVDEVKGPDVSASTEDDLALEVRAGRGSSPADQARFDRWHRLTPVFAAQAPAPQAVRWMATAGTFLELSSTVTDWAPADLTLDGLEIDSLMPALPLPVTFLALAIDGQGGQVAQAQDLWIGDPWHPGLFLAGRWLSTPDPVQGSGLIQGTLAADDGTPTGLALLQAQVVSLADLPASDPYGTGALACAPHDGPFEPNWLFQGHCTRDDVLGHTIVGVSP